MTKKPAPKKQQKDLTEQRNILRRAREATMAKRGFITVEEAARLAMHPRSNVYHWVTTGEVRTLKFGSGRWSVFVSLADLKKKVPAAFALTNGSSAKAKATPKRTRRASAKNAGPPELTKLLSF